MSRVLPAWDDEPERPVGKILAVGRNYADHAAEMQSPAEPVIFMKPITALRVPGESVVLPRGKGAIHHEAELVIWLQSGGTALSEAEAARCPGAVGLGLDLTLRDVQSEAKQAGKPWTLAKGFDGSLPVGRFLATERVGLLDALRFRLELNGELRQSGAASNMLLPVPRLLAFISSWITLEPGDLILTGTPAGVGPVVPGDTARITLDGWHHDDVVFA